MNTITPEMIESAAERCSAAGRALSDARCARAPGWRLLDKPLRDACEKLNRLQEAATEEFATSRGYTLAKRWFSIAQLLSGKRCRGENVYRNGEGRYFDHVQCLLRDGAPAAILSHSYESWPDIERWAAKRGMTVEKLPYSWWNPYGCVAVLFTAPIQPVKAVRGDDFSNLLCEQ